MGKSELIEKQLCYLRYTDQLPTAAAAAAGSAARLARVKRPSRSRVTAVPKASSDLTLTPLERGACSCQTASSRRTDLP